MAEAEQNGEKRSHPMQMNGFSRDLWDKYMNRNGKLQEIPGEDDEDVELSLGLSLNGRFGVDPQRAKRLKRSSSISDFAFTGAAAAAADDGTNIGRTFSGISYGPIARTCSLPVETEEECRKRKELQSLRRLEAKRKRMEKLQNARVVKDKELDENHEENGNCYSNGNGSMVLNHNGNGSTLPLSQGSMGSQGSGSSGISDFGSQPNQGQGDSTSIKSSEIEKKQVATQPETTSQKLPSINAAPSKEAKEMFKNFMLNMPCVSTKGDGPNGTKIEGFLYRYSKGEEVKIVCVCHGDFLSPAEFVKHAGGGDVAHPLRHIVVNPSPMLR